MPRYLISFDDGAMDGIAADELPRVADAAHAVVRAAKAAGVWIFGGGIARQQAAVVQPDGRVLAGPAPEAKRALGGFAVIDTESRADALQWAARIAAACRCAQEVREIMFDPQS
ncbi:MAG: YciI family protein [Burkholderiaceae bacterium]|nr:YciI family protein [Burkholderiaceae bacterium]